jgi:hypothetical protein
MAGGEPQRPAGGARKGTAKRLKPRHGFNIRRRDIAVGGAKLEVAGDGLDHGADGLEGRSGSVRWRFTRRQSRFAEFGVRETLRNRSSIRGRQSLTSARQAQDITRLIAGHVAGTTVMREIFPILANA